jgi:hypothetical protein
LLAAELDELKEEAKGGGDASGGAKAAMRFKVGLYKLNAVDA